MWCVVNAYGIVFTEAALRRTGVAPCIIFMFENTNCLLFCSNIYFDFLHLSFVYTFYAPLAKHGINNEATHKRLFLAVVLIILL